MGNMACPFCGRTWTVIGRQSGFIQSGANNHIYCCKLRTPKQRVAINRRDLKQWEKNPPLNKVIIPLDHPGLKEREGGREQ